MRRAAGFAVAIAVTVIATTPPAPAASAASDGAARAGRFLVAKQRADGTFAAGASPDATAETAAALLAAGFGREARRALASVRAAGVDRDARAGNAAKIVLALRTAGEDPRRSGGDHVRHIEQAYDPVTGAYDPRNAYANALAVLALLVVGEPVPPRAFERIEQSRCPAGGYASTVPCLRDADASVDATAIILHVLARADIAVDAARAWLASVQNDDGGFGAAPGATTNANSTGLALSAIAALGEDRSAWRAGGRTPVDALLALQLPSGGLRWRAQDDTPNVYATVQAIPGLLGMSYPLRAAAAARRADAVASATPERAHRSARAPLASASARLSAGAGSVPSAGPCARVAPVGTGPRRAGVVVLAGAGTPVERCVAFTEPTLTGAELLRRADVGAVYEDFGGGAVFVCAIAGRGRDFPRESCVPPCPSDARCAFWGYYAFDGRSQTWRFSDVGAAARVVRDGDVDGWRWGIHGRDGRCPPDPGVTSCGEPAPRILAASAVPARGRPVALAVAALTIAGLSWIGARARRRREEHA